MSIYKRDSKGKIIPKKLRAKTKGTWFYDFTVNGRRYKGAIKGAVLQSQAENYEAEKRIEVFEGRYGKPSQTIGFEEFATDRYLKWALQHKRSYRTDKFNLKAITAHFKNKILREITTADINTYLQQRREIPTRRGKPRSGASVNREQMLMSAIFRHAIAEGYCETNPVKGIKQYKETGRRKRIVNVEEEARILAALTGTDAKLRPVVILALNTGMRSGEIANLRWEDVDFDAGINGVIHLREGATKNQEARELPMNDQVRTMLLELRANKKAGRIFNFHEKYLAIRFARLCDQLGMPEVTLHTLRHTFNTRLIKAHISPLIVKKLMGHKNIEMTDYYAHTEAADDYQAVKRLENSPGCSGSVPQAK
ncbi:MAG TPA: site-specific integrase [Blastocatellia bacterium]|nr:site-specific integrase [Blastocatellia bacterium]